MFKNNHRRTRRDELIQRLDGSIASVGRYIIIVCVDYMSIYYYICIYIV